MTIIITSILSLLFITYIALNIFPSSRSLAEGDFTAVRLLSIPWTLGMIVTDF
jgi:hypothetical protein